MPAPDTHLVTGYSDAVAQAELVHSGELRPVDLVLDSITRIERLNPLLNAVVATDFDRAVDDARTLDPDLPFSGVPVLVKDLCAEVEGLPIREGSSYLRGVVSTHDQEYVARLRRAGFVVVGKTATAEFGMAPTVEPFDGPPTVNPWDTTCTTGGSSGGSAAAVASGMVPVAHGNDAGGSIRIPASCCGLFGLKPTRGRNPLGPRYGDVFAGLVAEHVLTRSVRDSVALLDVTAGPSPGDPYFAPPHEGTWAGESFWPPGRLRIAVSRMTAEGRPVHVDCLAVLDDTVDLLTSLGHTVVERELTELTPRVGSAIGRMYGGFVDWVVRYWAEEKGRLPEPHELEPLTRLYWERGREVRGGDLMMAVTTAQSFARDVAAAYDGPDGFDVWLSPTLAEPPPRLGELAATEEDPTVAEARAAAFVAYPLIAANLTGRPAMSVPLGWSSDDLPVGMNFMGQFGDEGTLFRLAGQLESARPWAEVWPPVSARCIEHDHPLTDPADW